MHTWNIDVTLTFIFVYIFSREIQFPWLFLGCSCVFGTSSPRLTKECEIALPSLTMWRTFPQRSITSATYEKDNTYFSSSSPSLDWFELVIVLHSRYYWDASSVCIASNIDIILYTLELLKAVARNPAWIKRKKSEEYCLGHQTIWVKNVENLAWVIKT